MVNTIVLISKGRLKTIVSLAAQTKVSVVYVFFFFKRLKISSSHVTGDVECPVSQESAAFSGCLTASLSPLGSFCTSSPGGSAGLKQGNFGLGLALGLCW